MSGLCLEYLDFENKKNALKQAGAELRQSRLKLDLRMGFVLLRISCIYCDVFLEPDHGILAPVFQVFWPKHMKN